MSRILKKKKRRANGESPHAAYKRTHWGEIGNFTTKKLRVPDPQAGDLVMLGVLRCVEYETDKGEGPQIFYHHFGRGLDERGRPDARKCPLLVFNREGLVIAGGEYRVKTEGIVG